MFTKKLSEHPMILTANIWVLMMQFVMIVGVQDDEIWTALTLAAFFTAMPLVIYAYCEVKLNNNLVNNGRLITAKIHHEESKIIFAIKQILILRVQCTFMENDVVHIFKDQYSFSMYERKQIMGLLNQTDTVDVLVDAEYKKYKILFRSVFHDMHRDYECPAFLNYVLLAINIGCAIVNFL